MRDLDLRWIQPLNDVGYVGNLSPPFFFGKAVAANPAWRLQFSLRFKF